MGSAGHFEERLHILSPPLERGVKIEARHFEFLNQVADVVDKFRGILHDGSPELVVNLASGRQQATRWLPIIATPQTGDWSSPCEARPVVAQASGLDQTEALGTRDGLRAFGDGKSDKDVL